MPSPPDASPPPVEPTASTGSIPREQLPVVEFLRAGGGVAELHVEVVPRAEFGIGLSGRYTLEERGMLFDYGPPAGDHPFWMQNTHIDLDIAFVASDLTIVAIRTMQAESREFVRAGVDSQYAIEAPRGWYADHRIVEGDRVRFTFVTPSEAGVP